MHGVFREVENGKRFLYDVCIYAECITCRLMVRCFVKTCTLMLEGEVHSRPLKQCAVRIVFDLKTLKASTCSM